MDIELGGTVLCFDAGRTKKEQKETAVNKQQRCSCDQDRFSSDRRQIVRGNWKVERKSRQQLLPQELLADIEGMMRVSQPSVF